jgi:predicted small secreted protein
MKKIVAVIALFLLIGTTSLVTSCNNNASGLFDDKVYICNSKSAKKYHDNENCRGLKNCTHDVDEISIDDAKEKGRTPCKICY